MEVIAIIIGGCVLLLVSLFWRELIWPHLRPPDVAESTSDDVNWFEQQKVREEDKEYEELLRYAKELYTESNSTFDALDRKAELLFGVSATLGTLLVALAASFQVDAIYLLPSLLLLFTSMFLSLLSRIPISKAGPLSIRDCLKIINERGEDQRLQPRLLKSYHVAVRQIDVSTEWKAQTIERASWFFFSALIAVSLALAFGANPEVEKDTTESGSPSMKNVAK